MNKIQISIIIPYFNSAATLSRAIDSILNQKVDFPFEVILVNDGSEDDYEIQLEKYRDRVNLISQYRKGVSAARNLGVSKANGDYLLFLDADDELEKDALEKFHLTMKEDSTTSVFLAGFTKINQKEQTEFYTKENQYNPALSGTYLIKRDVFLKVGAFDEKLTFSENTELFFRLDQFNASKKLLPFLSLKYHESIGGGSKNHKNKIDSLIYILNKHDSYLNDHVKRLFNQIIGVSYLRLGEYRYARTYLKKAYLFSVLKFKTLARLLLAYLPVIAKRLYRVTNGK